MWTRRNLLRSTAWLGAGAFANTLFRRAAFAADGGTGPKRLVIFFTPNGTIPQEFWPAVIADDNKLPSQPTGSPDFELKRILSPLASHKKDMILVQGPSMPPGEFVFGRAKPAVAGADKCPDDVGLSDHKVYMAFTGTCPTKNYAGGASLDQEVAKTLGKDTLRPSVVVSGAGFYDNRRGYLSYADRDRPVAAEPNPKKAYDYLFGSFMPSSNTSASTQLALRRSVLDVVKGDIGRLSSVLPAAERPKMDVHLDAVRSLEHALDVKTTQGAACNPMSPTFPTGGLNVPDAVRLHLKTIAAAFACDITRVASVMCAMGGGDNIGVDWIPGFPSFGYHDLAHATIENIAKVTVKDGADANEYWIRLSMVYSQLLADFITELKAIPEGNGTVFDNTTIVWLHEMSRGDSHWDLSQLPLVILGSAGGVLHTGQHVKTPQSTHLNDVLLTVANAVGHPIQSFGNPSWCSGPLDVLRV